MKWGRSVLATDICLNSLRMGHDFKEKNQITNVYFVQMNLFRPVFRQDTFDLVICNGVLHHTSDPFSGCQSISGLAKKGGYLSVGLYNTYGRIPQDIRRLIFRLTGYRLKFLDARLRDSSISDARKHIWFLDQYKNPRESKQTISDVLSWFDRSGVEFVNSIPKCRALEPFSPREKLFEARSRGTKFDHFLVQLGMLLSGGREGGFFVMIGRRKS
jgi:SAM-dependent methyltransferase